MFSRDDETEHGFLEVDYHATDTKIANNAWFEFDMINFSVEAIVNMVDLKVSLQSCVFFDPLPLNFAFASISNLIELNVMQDSKEDLKKHLHEFERRLFLINKNIMLNCSALLVQVMYVLILDQFLTVN